MSLHFANQLSFTSGVISPRLFGRMDANAFNSGLSRLTNAAILPQGGVIRRSGLKYVAAAKHADRAAQLVSFRFSTDQAYILEFGHLYMRVYTDGARVEDGGTPVEIATPYTEDELSALRFAQSADMLYIVHPDHAPATLSRTSDSSWRLAEITFSGGPFLAVNGTAVTLTPSDTTGDIILSASDDLFDDPGHLGALFRLIHSTGIESVSAAIIAADSYSASLSITSGEVAVTASCASWPGSTATVQRSYDNGVTWTDVAAYTSDTTASLPEISSGVLYRIGVKSGEYGGTAVTVGLSQVTSEAFGICRITAVNNTTEAAATVETPFASTDATTDWCESAWSAFRGFPSLVTFYEDRLLFAATGHQPQTVWGSQTGDYYNFLVSDEVVDSDAVQYTLLSRQVNSIRWMEPMRKLRLGTSDSEWWMAGASDSDPLTPSSVRVRQETFYGSASVPPVRIADSLVFVQRSGKILMESAYSLTSDAYAASDLSILAEHLTREDNIVQAAFSQYPLSIVWCLRSDGALLGLTLQKEHQVAGWHLHETQGNIESIAVIPGDSEDELWVVAARNVNGETKRSIERLAPFFSDSDTEQAFFVDCGLSQGAWNTDGGHTLTVSGGSTWESGDTGSLTASGHYPFSAGDVGSSWRLRSGSGWCEVYVTAYNDVNDVDVAFVSDIPSALQGTATTDWIELSGTVSGLDHLEGESVSVLADGGPHPERTVSGGQISLDAPAGVVHAGLSYVTDIATCRPAAIGRKRAVSWMALRVCETRGGKAGPDEDRLTSLPFTLPDSDFYDAVPRTLSGDVVIDFPKNPDTDGSVLIRQDQPLPLTLLALSFLLEVFDR